MDDEAVRRSGYAARPLPGRSPPSPPACAGGLSIQKCHRRGDVRQQPRACCTLYPGPPSTRRLLAHALGCVDLGHGMHAAPWLPPTRTLTNQAPTPPAHSRMPFPLAHIAF